MALFGAGQIGASLLARLTSENIKIDCFIDNKKTGEFCGLPIVALDQIKNENVNIYIATLDYYDEIEQQLLNLNLPILGSKDYLKYLFTCNKSEMNEVTIDFDVDFAISQMEYFCIDLVDSCQLKCPCCSRGVRAMANSKKYMQVEKFMQVCYNVKQHNFKKVALYNWSEPFIKSDLEEYIKVFRSIVGDDVYLSISSNLSLKKMPHLKNVLLSGANELLVSVSGFFQTTHEIYHKGSKIDVVKKHLEHIASFINETKTQIFVKYLNFGYNKNELPLFEEYSYKLGLNFTSTTGYGSPLRLHEQPTLEFYEKKIKDHLYGKFDINKYQKGIKMFCNASLCINCDADVYLCCRYPNLKQFKLGNYLENNIKQIIEARQLHPFCTRCDAKMY